LLDPAANARRLAKLRYPVPLLFDLWQAIQTNPKAVENFMRDRKGKGPIVEVLRTAPSILRVTYLYLGDDQTESVREYGGPHQSVGGLPMTRFLKTLLFFRFRNRSERRALQVPVRNRKVADHRRVREHSNITR